MSDRFIRKLGSIITIFALIVGQIMPSQSFAQNVANLPIPGTMVTISPSYNPAIVAGITIYPENPLLFDFIIDVGDDHLGGEALRKESQKLISYFMATLTVPEDEMWVNLSPYEKERIIADGLGDTVLGRDMLAQDYILKQLTASMMYPEDKLGNEFWQRVYKKEQDKFGTTEMPTNTFNKIWIVPEEAVIYVNGTNIFVANSRLKVMMEEDYLALEHHDKGLDAHAEDLGMTQEVMTIFKEVLLPEIEKEVNEGKNFAPLRQIYHSMILATWYKNNLRESLLGKVYVNQNKVNGVDVSDRDVKNKIYNQYVEAFKKGVYDYVREDYDQASQEVIPRKYFSGGEFFAKLSDQVMVARDSIDSNDWLQRRESSPKVRVQMLARLEKSTIGSSPVSDNAMLANDFLTLDDLEISGKRLLVRPDINAPVSEEGRISLTERFIGASETVKEASGKGAKVVIIAHQGRPGDDDYLESLEQHAQLLAEQIGRPVRYVDDLYGEKAVRAIESLADGEVIMLKNVRPQEADSEFTETLEPLFDYFIIDGFSVAHRDTNSVTGFKNIPNIAGRLMQRELEGNQKFISAIEHPYVELLGGSKISDHVEALEYGLNQGLIDHVLTGGMLGYLLLVIDGYNLGQPTMDVLREQDFDETERPDGLLSLIPTIQAIYEKHRDKFEIPSDLAFENASGEREEIQVDKLGKDGVPFVVADNGKDTADRYAAILRTAKTGFVKGPQGNYKNVNFKESSEITIGALAESGAFWMTGGGDTDVLVSDMGHQPSHRTLAGGAFLKFKSGKELPAVKRLNESKKQFKGEDSAMPGSSSPLQNPGGIDFNAGNLHLKEQGNAADINFTNLPNIQANTVNGVTPIIINITPIVNFPLLISKLSNENSQLSQKLKTHNVTRIR